MMMVMKGRLREGGNRSLHILQRNSGSWFYLHMPVFDSMSLWILSIGSVGVQAGVTEDHNQQKQSLSQTHIHKLIHKQYANRQKT